MLSLLGIATCSAKAKTQSINQIMSLKWKTIWFKKTKYSFARTRMIKSVLPWLQLQSHGISDGTYAEWILIITELFCREYLPVRQRMKRKTGRTWPKIITMASYWCPEITVSTKRISIEQWNLWTSGHSEDCMP